MSDGYRHAAEITEISNMWENTCLKWKARAEKTEKSLEFKSKQYDELSANFDKLYQDYKELRDAQIALINEKSYEVRDRTSYQIQLAKAERALVESQRTNAMNYAEKKVFAAYSRELRNASSMNPVFEPLLYAGDKGAWIRERVRMAALRVYNAGGDIHDAADAAIAEMRVHVKVMVPSESRRAQIEKEKIEVVLKNVDMPEGTDPSTMLRQCDDLHPC